MIYLFKRILIVLLITSSFDASPLLASHDSEEEDQTDVRHEKRAYPKATSAFGKELVGRGQQQGISTREETPEGPVIIPKINIRKTVEEPSPFSQPHYWRGLLIQSLVVGGFSALLSSPGDVVRGPNKIIHQVGGVEVVSTLSSIYFISRGHVGSLLKVVGTNVGYVVGEAVGISVSGHSNHPLFCGIGAAAGFGVTSIIIDGARHSVRRLLGWNKKVTLETFEKIEK